jgi:hypothetical protein
MLYYAIKTVITLVLILAIAEISKRSSVIGGILASVPLISVLAMVWLYVDTQDTEKVAMLARSIFWLVLPSLSLFISLPILLANGMNFWLSLTVSMIIMTVCYLLMIYLLAFTGFDASIN